MKKTGLVLAVTAAAMFVAGCATQGTDSSVAPAQPVPVAAQPANSCKNMSSCKGKSTKKRHKRAKKASENNSAQQQGTDTSAAASSTSVTPGSDTPSSN